MKATFRFSALFIPNKLRVELKTTFDEKTEYRSAKQENDLSVRTFPWLNIILIKPYEPNEVRAWSPNDILGLSPYTLPVFIENLSSIYEGMKTPDLYKYTNNRLELNEESAEKIRKVFMISNTTVELSAVVIEQNDVRIEGIKMKFNNESSTVALSLNDIEALLYNLKKVSLADFAWQAYCHYKAKGNSGDTKLGVIDPVMVDIAPLNA